MGLSFSVNVKDYHYNYYGIGNFFHNHVLVHIHDSRAIFHSLQGMAHIVFDRTGESPLIAHYFVQ